MGALKKINKKWYISGAIILVILAGIFIWNSNKKYDITKDMVVTYEGYDGQGSVDYNSESIAKKMVYFIGEKEGIKKEDIARIVEDEAPTTQKDPQLYYKISELEREAEDVKIEFSKEDDLSNGEKVKLTVKTSSKDTPIKNVEKTYTVKGLEKVKKVDIKDIKKNLDIKFKGFNKKGQVKLNSKNFKGIKFHVKNNGKLSNNDNVKMVLNTNNFNNNGKEFIGNNKVINVKVTGFKSADKIEDIQDVIQASTDYANSQNKNDISSDYKVELVHFYIEGHTDGYYEDDPDETVYVNQKVNTSSEYDVFGLYKITANDGFSDRPDVKYMKYGHFDVPLKDNNLSIDEMSTDSNGMSEMLDDTLPVIERNLKSEAILIN